MSARLRTLQHAFGGVLRGRTLKCPTHGHSAKDRGTSIKEVFGAPGDLVVFVHNGTQADALAIKDRALDVLGEPRTGVGLDREESPVEAMNRRVMLRQAEEAERADTLRRVQNAARIWHEAQDPRGTLVEAYLRSRGLGLPDAVAGTALRWHPCGPWDTGAAPMMVAAMRDVVTGDLRAIHRTALTTDGQKIDRWMLGPAKGTAIMLTPAAETLVVGEGIETVLTALQLGFGPGAWAMGSAGAIKALPVLDGVQRLVLLEEEDATSAAAVAEVGERWTQAGRTVSVVTPTTGNDLNDALRERGPGATVADIAVERPFGGVAPTFEDTTVPLEEAKPATAAAVNAFFVAANAFHALEAAAEPDATESLTPPVHALAVGVAIGKTNEAGAAIARYVAEGDGTVLYCVPTHKLSEQVASDLGDLGVRAEVWYGREAPDPENPGATMCGNLEDVKLAVDLGVEVQSSVCIAKTRGRKGKPAVVHKCPLYDGCAYQLRRTAKPQVWVVAHPMLWQAQKALGDVAVVVIDESFWQSGTIIPTRGLTLDEVGAGLTPGEVQALEAYAERTISAEIQLPGMRPVEERRRGLVDEMRQAIEWRRSALARVLRRQDQPGGLRREHVVAEGLNLDLCVTAQRDEWVLKRKTTLRPGMSAVARKAAAAAASGVKHARRRATLWRAMGNFLADEGAEVSGRVYLDRRDEGEGAVTTVRVRGVKRVAKAWRRPTLILDATLPDTGILRAFYPQVEVTARVNASLPEHVRVKQILGAPVAKRKLKPEQGKDDNANMRAVRWFAIREHVRLGRQPTVVIPQKHFATWLRAPGRMPERVAVEHLNNIAGLNKHKHVRTLITVGQTQPGPEAFEALAGALTGREPIKAERFERVTRGLRMRDGTGVAVTCDAHPDPMCEAIRKQVNEAQLIQAVGRGRAVRRTADKPLDVIILGNVALDLSLDAVEQWSAPGEEVEMLADGLVLESPSDMAKAWPSIWTSEGAAKKWGQRRNAAVHTGTDPYREYPYIGVCPRVTRFRYQHPGARQKWRQGAFDPAVFEDATAARAWLEAGLGTKLAGFEILEAEAPRPNPADRNALLDPATGYPASASALVALTACGERPTAGAERPYTAVRLPRCADYAPELAASYRCAVDVPAPEPAPLKPVVPEVAAMRPDDEAALLARMRARPGFMPPRPAVVRDLDGQSAKLAGTLGRFLELGGRAVV